MSWLSSNLGISIPTPPALAKLDPTVNSFGGGILQAVGINTPPALVGLDPTTHPLSNADIREAAKAGAAYFIDPTGATSAKIVAAQYASHKRPQSGPPLAQDINAGPVANSVANTNAMSDTINGKPLFKNPLVILAGIAVIITLARA